MHLLVTYYMTYLQIFSHDSQKKLQDGYYTPILIREVIVFVETD